MILVSTAVRVEAFATTTVVVAAWVVFAVSFKDWKAVGLDPREDATSLVGNRLPVVGTGAGVEALTKMEGGTSDSGTSRIRMTGVTGAAVGGPLEITASGSSSLSSTAFTTLALNSIGKSFGDGGVSSPGSLPSMRRYSFEHSYVDEGDIPMISNAY